MPGAARMTLTVRSASKRDANAVLDLWRSCNLISPTNDPHAEFQFALGKPGSDILLGITTEGDIIGSVMVGHDGHRGWLYYVATAPSVRGKGFGRELVNAAENWLRERGIAKVQLLVTETNKIVMPFYEGLGFDVSPRIVMSKRLDATGPDVSTMSAYDGDAKSFADDWHSQPAPTDLHDAVTKFFIKGPTADVGCGSGRDTAWLNESGYPAIGYDASEGLLTEARNRYPSIKFLKSTLPDLACVKDASFQNVLCETVIMHLPTLQIGVAVKRLLDILVTGGVLYLSWRVTQGANRRDEHGRLYAAFDPNIVLDALKSSNIMLDEEVGSISSGKLIRRVVAMKS